MTSKTHSKAKTVYFDLGNVLIFFNMDKMFNQLSQCTKIPVTALRQGYLEDKILQKYETGRMSSEEFYRLLQSKSSFSFSFHEMMAAMADMFTPNTELWPVVEELKKQGARLVLISNTNECHFNFAYSHFPVLHLFDSFILSYEVGACKPEPLIFKKALLEAEGRTFYTDDVPDFIAAGRAAGLDAELFTDVPTLERHLLHRGFLS
jgi:glucose-1-phosphatase